MIEINELLENQLTKTVIKKAVKKNFNEVSLGILEG